MGGDLQQEMMPQAAAETSTESVVQDAAGHHRGMSDLSAAPEAVCVARLGVVRLSYAFNFPKTPRGV